jgi:hypothetical protein
LEKEFPELVPGQHRVIRSHDRTFECRSCLKTRACIGAREFVVAAI